MLILIFNFYIQLFTRGGYKVTMYDISSEQLMGVATAISDQLERLEKEGLLGEGQTKQLLMARITYEIDLAEAVKGACYIQVYCNLVADFENDFVAFA